MKTFITPEKIHTVPCQAALCFSFQKNGVATLPQDVINVGREGRWGGASSAAAFLEQFILEERWAHIDIAPRAFISKSRPWMRAGATGAGVHLGVEIVKHM